MKLYNTLTHDVQDFAPADGKTVKMYVCGVTPYSSTHVGHAFSYVAFDTLRRYLEFLGFDVRHVQNFTDVDDKIIQRAQEQGIDPDDLAEQFIDDFYRTMDALNIQRADIYPRATQEIGPIIETIQTLVDNGSAYPAGGDMFFRVTKKDDYGKLSHRTLDGMQAGVSRSTRIKNTPWTSCSGRARAPGSRLGKALGGRAGPVGTSSAPPWL